MKLKHTLKTLAAALLIATAPPDLRRDSQQGCAGAEKSHQCFCNA
ncbi:hypothetical protein [Candidatus Accumulibacter phosphatis]|nr:hypothetical protein [Candidatus Accumulibacter phosphatis]